MFIVDELTGDITLRQGDNGVYTLLKVEVNYVFTPYLAVSTQERIQVGEPIIGTVNQDGSVDFIFKPSFTDLLVVDKNEEDATYYFAIKIKQGINENEDTLVIGNKTIYETNTITVLPKLVEEGV